VTSVRIGAVGDVHGSWQVAVRQLWELDDRVGGLDVVFQVGDGQAYRHPDESAGLHPDSRHRDVHSDYPSVVDGRGPPAPVYFIGGNHEPWPALDDSGPGPWGRPDVSFLGRAGCVRLAGLVVAFLSGIGSAEVSDLDATQRVSPAQRAHWVHQELDTVRESAAAFGHVDVLLTHNWPASLGFDRHGQPAGDAAEARLAADLHPTLYLCGHYHRRYSTSLDGIGVEAMGLVTAASPDGVAAIDIDSAGTYRVL
jgi:hypothetical protein